MEQPDPGEIKISRLKQVYLNKDVINEDVEKFGEDYRIPILSQTIQTVGFHVRTHMADHDHSTCALMHIMSHYRLKVSLAVLRTVLDRSQSMTA